MPASYQGQRAHLDAAARVLNELKTTAGCVDCGFKLWPEALHFDHIDPQSKHNSLGWVRDRSKLTSKSRLRRYLDHVSRYCVVRCANCHAHRSVQEEHWKVRRDGQKVDTEEPTLF